MTAVQLLAYIADIWKLHNAQYKNDKLPVVIPILIYHGNKSWSFGDRLSELIGDSPESILDYIPDYKYLVYDFSKYSDSEIKGEIKLRLFLKLISHIFDDDFENGLREVLPLLSELEKKVTGMEYIETVVKYILNVGEEISLDELNKKAKNISSEGSEFIMSIAEKLKEEGRIETMQEMIEFSLELKFGMSSKFLVKDIKKIDDYDKLKEIKFAIKSYDTLEELTNNLEI